MNSPDIIAHFSDFKFFDALIERINATKDKRKKIFISSLFGAANSLLIKELSEIENHIIILLPDDKLASELSVELEYLNITSKKILLTEFNLVWFR